MKKIIISLMLAGFVPASGAAQSSTPGRVNSQVSSTPPCRARTLDLRAQSVMDTTDTSAYLYNEALSWNNSTDPQNGLDTMRLFVERHPNLPLDQDGFPLAEDGLSYTYIFTGEVASKDTNNIVREQCWIGEYNWLASVYPLDTARTYRLNVIGDMAECEEQFDLNGSANLWYNFSILFPDSADVADAGSYIAEIRNMQKINGEDTTPFYVIPMPPQPYKSSAVQVSPKLAAVYSAFPNPASTGTTITFGINQEAYVKIDLFDLLGQSLSSVHFESLFAPGNKSVPISLMGLPSGTYYARIMTAYGEVQTVKLVKE